MAVDISAFGAVAPEDGHPRDPDGVVIPKLWQARPDKWEKLPLGFRQRNSAAFLEEEARKAAKAAEPPKKARPYVPRFSTQAAIEWGKRQQEPGCDRKWLFIDRERYDARRKEHHDLELGVDAIFDDRVNGRVGIQGAGVGERKEHFQRFVERGGGTPEEAIAKARRRNIRIVYCEFVRGKAEPVKVEWWA